MSVPVIQTAALSKSFGNSPAVIDLNLAVGSNRITAFLGRNGAGKSTTIQMLLGITHPSAGNGTVLGTPLRDAAGCVKVRQRIAYVSETKRLYDYMTVEQMIRFTRSFYPDWRVDQERILLRRFELPLHRKIQKLSKGMRTKLALLLALARQPELMILDEPGDGLDPVGIEQLLESLVAQCSEGVSIFFSSHQIAEVERIADHVCILDRGRLVMDAALDEVRQSYRRIDVVFPAIPDEIDFRISGVEEIRTRGHHMSLLASKNAEAIVARAQDLHARSIDCTPVGLRDIFLEKVKESQNDALV